MMFEAQTYSRDRELFDKLGLRKFAGRAGHEWLDLGTVEDEWADVKVEVCCLPAQFFRFTVTSKIEDVQSVVLLTGSGTLSDYWPTVCLWVQGAMKAQPVMSEQDVAPAVREP